MKKNKYFTGLIVLNSIEISNPIVKGRGWELKFEKCRKIRNTKGDVREVIIFSNKWEIAQKTLNLILASINLINGEASIFKVNLMVHNNNEPSSINRTIKENIKNSEYATVSIPLACEIAAKASYNSKWVNAISKYNFSLSLFSVFSVDLNPYSYDFFGITIDPTEHVTYSYAIVSAYSSIEEIGLELRASNKNPSRINGEWNPKVKNELESRLLKRKINLKEHILWLRRGPTRNFEKKRKLSIVRKADWSGTFVKDAEIRIVDAIAFADWMRDKFAAHKVIKGMTSSLNAYDITNVQSLSRRLLLESLGFWSAISPENHYS